jgi:hypothetical protein
MLNRKHIPLAALIAAALSLIVVPAFAKGAMPVRVTGPGLPAAGIEITDPADYLSLGMGSLPDFQSPTDPPTAPRIGYTMQRFGVDDAGKKQIFDDLVYYPGPPGERGIVYYVGIHNGSSEYDGKWFYASRSADAVLRRLLGLAQQCGPTYCLD